MADYMKDANLPSERKQCVCSPSVIQNLKDAGCDRQTAERFMELEEAKEVQGQLRLLEKHRRGLLDRVHKIQKQIDCLDYLVYQMKKRREYE